MDRSMAVCAVEAFKATTTTFVLNDHIVQIMDYVHYRSCATANRCRYPRSEVHRRLGIITILYKSTSAALRATLVCTEIVKS
ncbi:MAG: hypothetical protein J1F13_07165 [Prevotellaceae bacterium]|nr:hypothetical protein [Prevotellaceae bacterium]